ncbi:uncharacterized protein [Spinacia oleracea]|uniref:TTF-type domain-containing protein n=1 Tax=Spinacia oleracea TaxID=3562 RepID=A0A9R0IVB3_SPIOL|nr:uncharacterized protein LOC110795516 [Spinacia oleracea]
MMGKQKHITSFFNKRKEPEKDTPTSNGEKGPSNIQRTNDAIPSTEDDSIQEEVPASHNINIVDIGLNSLERDPGLRPPMWVYPVGKRDEIRRAYKILKVYQPRLKRYPLSGQVQHRRSFQCAWYDKFPDWLEYSPSKDAAFCLPCYLYYETPNSRMETFTVSGFKNWKRVNNGKDCAFLTHIGKGPCSSHKNAVQSFKGIRKQKGHIRNVLNKQSEAQIKQNRLRLKTSIDVIRLLTLQACPLRGHDESIHSDNQGNFLEYRKNLALYNKDVSKAIRQAPYNAKYIAPSIQKEILHIISCKIRNYIREEIGDSKFCIIVDEARDESKREQMGLVLRFVDKCGSIMERFFDLVHVSDTTAVTLKGELCTVLARNNLAIENIRGQGYDGASNIRGEWNGLQALFLSDCPYAYYVHCFAHRLQLALVAASRDVSHVHQFFSHLSFIVNVISASPKRQDELQTKKAAEIEFLLSIGELETGRGSNQKCTLKRAGDTRWGSHVYSIRSLIKMYDAIVSVMEKIKVDKFCNNHQRGDADGALDLMISYDFVFIAHMMESILGIADVLSQALQQKNQDIVNALKLVSTTKSLLQKMREDGWSNLVEKVGSFCEQHDILIPDMSAPYIARKGRARHQPDQVTKDHYYRVEIFIASIDKQLHVINKSI